MLKMGPHRLWSLFSILLAASVNLTTQNKVQIIPANGEIYLGASKTFLCKARSEGTLTWLKGDDEEIENEEGRFALKPIDESNYGINITARGYDLNGKVIKCHAEFESGEPDVAKITMRVIEKPQFTSKREKVKEFAADSLLNIPCSAKGTPVPRISWISNGVTLPSTQGRVSVSAEGTLQINKVRLSDAGIYTCRAWIQERREEELWNLSVIVNAPPVVQFQDKTQNGTIKSDIQLNCSVTGYPEPTVNWRRGSDPIKPNVQKYALSPSGRELSILWLEKSDEGEYTCTATNTFGGDSSTLRLNVIAPQTLGGGVVAAIVLLVLLVVILAVDLTCYRTRRKGFLMYISSALMGKPNPSVKLQENEIMKGSNDKCQVVNISGIHP